MNNYEIDMNSLNNTGSFNHATLLNTDTTTTTQPTSHNPLSMFIQKMEPELTTIKDELLASPLLLGGIGLILFMLFK